MFNLDSYYSEDFFFFVENCIGIEKLCNGDIRIDSIRCEELAFNDLIKLVIDFAQKNNFKKIILADVISTELEQAFLSLGFAKKEVLCDANTYLTFWLSGKEDDES